MTGAVEIPAYVFLCIWMQRVGRRKTMLTFLLMSSFICVVYVVIPSVSWCVFFVEWLWRVRGKTFSVFQYEDQFRVYR